jgi:hypothetical protein
MPSRRWSLLGARRFGRPARRALAGVDLEQAEMRMVRRRTGHESLLSAPKGAVYHGFGQVGAEVRL